MYMHILLSTETYLPWITGVSISTDNIAHYMASKGHRVTIVCPTSLVKGEVPDIPNVAIIHLPSLPFTFYNQRPSSIFPLAIPKIQKIIKEEKIDIVHIQEPGETGVATLIAAKLNHIPVVGYLHFIPEQIDRVLWGSAERILTPLINIYVKFIYSKYDSVMTPSHFFKNYLKFLGIKKPIEVISNGVDTKVFSPQKYDDFFRKKYKIPSDSILFFYLGRLDGDKNVGTLIKAMKYTKPNAHMLIIGKGKIRNYLHELAKRLGVDPKITWIDFISNEEMPAAYNASDVFTIVSPYEGQSIVALQAAASGLPIIAASAGALPEIARNNENGFLVHTHDFKDLANKMNQLADNAELRKRFGKESRHISLRHTRTEVFKQIEAQYSNILQLKRK